MGWSELATSHSPVQDNRFLHRVAQELLDVVPLQRDEVKKGLAGT